MTTPTQPQAARGCLVLYSHHGALPRLSLGLLVRFFPELDPPLLLPCAVAATAKNVHRCSPSCALPSWLFPCHSTPAMIPCILYVNMLDLGCLGLRNHRLYLCVGRQDSFGSDMYPGSKCSV